MSVSGYVTLLKIRMVLRVASVIATVFTFLTNFRLDYVDLIKIMIKINLSILFLSLSLVS